MKYLKKFNEHNDYEEYIEGSDKQLPNVSVCVNENHKHYTQKPRPLIAKFFVKGTKNVKIWIDDFPERVAEGEYEGDMDAFKEDFVENYEQANPYLYTGATFELEGNTYYLFEYLRTEEEDEGGYYNCHYILTDTLDFEGKSFSEDLHNNYCPAIYTLNIDMGTYDWRTGNIDTDKLLVRYEFLNTKTKLIFTDYLVDKIEIDGVVQDEVISEYDFTEDGEHIVRYKLKENINNQIDVDMFYGCDMYEFIITNGIEYLRSEAFSYCNNLSGITIPKTLNHIIGTTIYYDTNIQKIVVDSRNTTYDSRDNSNAIIETSTNTLLYGCNGTIIPSSVTSIRSYAFYNIKIDFINIPDNITYIGNNAFENTTYLNYITFDSTTPPSIGLNVFDCDNDYPIYVPDESVNAYKTATNWNVYDYRIFAKGYYLQYFTTVALEDGTISFDIFRGIGTDMITSISYSTDNGETWTTTNNVNDKEENLVITVDVSEGDKVLWKGDAQQLAFYDEDYGFLNSFFSSDCEFDVMGNVMSLLYGDNFVGETTVPKEYCFFGLFCDFCDTEKECLVVNANNLKLPATTLTEHCYEIMFFDCTSLTTAPELPATTLADSCYNRMFQGCQSLTSAPELPAITLVNNCYNYMFYGCTSLSYIKAMFTTTPSTAYTQNWVKNVAASGTFVKNSAATWTTTGVNGVPTGWTVQPVSE